MTKAFIVHGHSQLMYEIESYLRSEVGVEGVVILKDQSHSGETVLEALESRADVDVVIAVWTADDLGNANGANPTPRARQNVIFESGYFIAKMGRSRVIIIYDESIELPSDLAGLIYVRMSSWRADLRRQVIRILRPPRELLAEMPDLVAYLPLADKVEDIAHTPSTTRIINAVDVEPSRMGGVFDSRGLRFDGNTVVQVHKPDLPVHRENRTFTMWLRFTELGGPVSNGIYLPRFVFCYGGEAHGKSFGLFHGSPFFEPAMAMEPGLRVFFFCDPRRWSLSGEDACDSGPFSAVPVDRWLHVALTYDGGYVKSYLNGRLVTSIARGHGTEPCEVMNIGGFLPGKEEPYSGYNFHGYIREFMAFRRELTGEEIDQIFHATRHLVQ
ncbi:TIR domain-containing protein [Kineosporia babensis]|uniref:Nucleotide-binding protein n=1 Tax=Kineosporia babensis TaxID=499548 RepID=A0A9X1NLK9_9ACTN|nr:TIR domain-containing protein [Kineosporia babensis]MCD5317272.1 nucleotide-binding protein [Kineosporia babensis]